jgi:hypothetical protein
VSWALPGAPPVQWSAAAAVVVAPVRVSERGPPAVAVRAGVAAPLPLPRGQGRCPELAGRRELPDPAEFRQAVSALSASAAGVSRQEALAASAFELAAFALEASVLSAVAPEAFAPGAFALAAFVLAASVPGASGRTAREQARARSASVVVRGSAAAFATWQCRPCSSAESATSCLEEVYACYGWTS